MKNRILLLLILLIASANNSFASQEPKVISDGATKKQVMDAFADINQNTNNFFTPVVRKDLNDKSKEKRKQIDRSLPITQGHGSIAPVKKLRIKWQNRNMPKQTAEAVVQPSNQAILDCDLMEYFAERTELEANGNVVMFFPKNNSTIKADKLIYNQTSNLIKAYGKVVLINDKKELYGDYMQVDLNEENAVMDEPVTDFFQVHSHAKKGYMYGDKLIQEQGNLLVTKKTMIKVRSEMFGPDLDRMYVNEKDKALIKKDSHGEAFKIKTNDLIINSKPEHDTVTLRHAEIYYNEKKIGTIPTVTVHTNKKQDYAEANYPEFGTMSNMGFFAGPGFVFDTPKGTNLKLVPMFNMDGDKMGFGGIAKFKSAVNKVDMAYGTANQTFIARGKMRLDDNLYFQYGSNAYMDDWFLGFRMPKYMGELVYEDSFQNEDFLGSNRSMNFMHRIALGYMQDRDVGSGNVDSIGGNGDVGTMRFKYMGEVAQTIYNFNDSEDFLKSNLSKDEALSTRLEMVFQGSAAAYGTGDTQMIARVGPRLHTQYKYWMQDAGYFLSGYNDKTPLIAYDKYMYGRSNVYLRETVRLNKYLTLSWFGSLNLSNDAWNGNLFQENSFFFSVGPDDVKLHFGYDTVRQQSFVTMAFALDAKGSSIEYKKMVIKNPDTLGKNKNGNDSQTQSFSPSADEEGSAVQRAEVIDIKEAI